MTPVAIVTGGVSKSGLAMLTALFAARLAAHGINVYVAASRKSAVKLPLCIHAALSRDAAT